MKLLSVFLVLGLSACTISGSDRPKSIPTTPAKKPLASPAPLRQAVPPVIVQTSPQVTVPALSEADRRDPPKLPELSDGSIKGIMRDGALTDSMYNNLASRYRALVRTYDCVREAVNAQTSAKIDGCVR